MSNYVDTSASAAAAQQAVIARALRASGVIAKMDSEEFLRMVDLNDEPVVLHADYRGMFQKYHQYLTAYRGLTFYSRTKDPLRLPDHAQIVTAEAIWIP